MDCHWLGAETVLWWQPTSSSTTTHGYNLFYKMTFPNLCQELLNALQYPFDLGKRLPSKKLYFLASCTSMWSCDYFLDNKTGVKEVYSTSLSNVVFHSIFSLPAKRSSSFVVHLCASDRISLNSTCGWHHAGVDGGRNLSWAVETWNSFFPS